MDNVNSAIKPVELATAACNQHVIISAAKPMKSHPKWNQYSKLAHIRPGFADKWVMKILLVSKPSEFLNFVTVALLTAT